MTSPSRFNIRFIAPLVVFLVIVVLLGIGLGLNPRYLPSTMIGKPAPAFNLAVLNAPQQRFSPSDMLGQRWLLNVWASWCVSCRYEHPLFNQLACMTLCHVSTPQVGFYNLICYVYCTS